MRKLTTFALVIVMLVLMTAALVACNVETIVVPDDQNPNKIPVEEVGANPDAMQMLNIISAAMSIPEGTANIDFALPVTVKGKPYDVTLKGNLPTTAEDKLEMALTVKESGSVIFGMYISGGKLFIEAAQDNGGDNLKFYIEDINFDAFYNLLSQLDFDQVKGKIDELLAGSGLPVTVDSVIQLVGGLIFKVESYKTTAASQEIDLSMEITPLLQMVAPLLPTLNIDGLLSGAGINVNGLGDFLEDLLASIPQFKVNIHSVIMNGESKIFDVKLNTSEEIVGCSVSLAFSNEHVDIDMPSSFDEYEPFSLTNIAFNINFGIKTTQLDVGKLINRFIPNTLPENMLVFTSDRQFVLKLNMDLDPKDNNNNLILLEVYRGSDPNANEKRLLGAYFIDGSLKINVDEISSAIAVPNIEIKGLNLTAVVGGIFDLIGNTIEGAVESLTGGEPSAASSLGNASEQAREDFIIPVSVDETGAAIIAPSISSFINSLVSVFGMTDFIVLGGDNLTITVNDAFFEALKTLVPSLDETLAGFPSIGEAVLTVNFFEKGIHDIDLTYRPNSDDDYININLNNFLFGFSTPDLKKTITERTYGKEYVNNVQDLLNGALDGVSLGGSVSLNFKQGTYDLAEMLKMFVTLPSMKFSVPQDVNVTAKIKLQMSYDAINVENSKGLFEIWLEDDFVFLHKGKLLGVYLIGNDLYLEVNGLGSLAVPKIKVKSDIMTMLSEEIAKLDLDFVLDGLLDNLIPPSLATVGDAAADAAANGETAFDSILNILDIDINEEALNLRITSLALQSLLAKFGINLTLPYIDITAEVRELNDIKIGANLMNLLTVNLAVNELSIGKAVDVELPPINEDEYCGDLQELVNGIMKGADLNLDLQLKLNQGFDVIAMVEEMGAILPIDMNIVLESDVILDINLKLQLAYDATNINNSKFLLEIVLKQDVLFFKAGKLLSAYGHNGKLYIDIAPIQGIKVPNIELDIDILKLLSDQVSSLDVDFIMQLGGGVQPASMVTVADSPAESGFEDNFNLLLHQDYIKLYVTGMALNELLKTFGVGGITLPEFSAEINVDEIDDITIDLNMVGKMSFRGQINSMTIGQEVIVDLPVINEDEYTPSLDKIVGQLFNGVHLEASLKADLKAGEYNIAYLLQMFGVVIPDAYIKVPVNTSLEMRAVFKMSYDEFNPSNSKILLEIYVLNDVLKLISGSNTVPFIAVYGIGSMLYLELNNLNNIDIPKVKVEADVFGLILDEVGKMDLQEIIRGILPQTPAPKTTGELSAVADSDVTIIVNRETLMIAATFRAIANLFDTAGILADIPDFDISAEITGIDSIILSANGVLNMLDLSLTFGVKKLGVPVIIDLPAIDPNEYSGNLTELVTGAFDGVDAEINLKIDLYRGVYDVADILSQIPNLNLPPISIDVTEDTTLDLTLKVQMKYDRANPSASKALLEFTLNKDVVFAKAGKLLSVYAFDGFIYLELANFKGISVPKVKVECDLMGLLKNELDKIDLDFIINGANTQPSPAPVGNQDQESNDNQISTVSDLEATINADSLRFAVTSRALAAILAKMNVNIVLPEFDIKADIKSLGEMSFDINLDSILNASLSVSKLTIGDPSVIVGIPENIDTNEYVGNLENLINGLLEGVDIEATLDLSLKKGEYNLASLLSMFKGVAAPDMKFTVGEDTVLSVTLKIQIKNDATNTLNSSALIELYINNDVLIFNRGLLFGLYATNGKTYLSVSPDGAIDGIIVPKIMLNNDLFGELKKIIKQISVDFKLDIGGIVSGNGGNAQQTLSTTASVNDSITATINQNSLKLAVTSHAIAQLLQQFGITISLPDMDITAEIKNIDDITINLGFMSLLYADLHIGKLNIGNTVTVDLPIIDESEYSGDLSGLVKELLDGVSIEASLDLTLTPDFDINKIINAFGINIEMPNVSLGITQPLTLGARMLLQLDYDKANPAASNGLFEIWLTALDLPPIFDVDGSKVKPFIGAYIENGKVYLELNNIVGLSVPKVMLDCDVFGILNDIIAKNNIEFVIDFGTGGGATPTAGNTDNFAAKDVIDIGINPNALQLKATLMAVMDLLDYFGLTLAIPEIPLDVDITIGSLSDIALKVNALEMMNMTLKVTDFRFGDNNIVIDLSNKIIKDELGNVIEDAYNADLSNLLGDILNGIDLRANLRLEVLKTFDLAEFISGFGVDLPNLDITFPQNLVLDVTLTVQVKYDKVNPSETRVLIELMNNRKTLFFNKGLLLGIYMFGNDAYIMVGGKSVDGLNSNPNEMGGIAGVNIPVIKIRTDIMDLLAEELAKIDIGFVIDSNTINPPASGGVTPVSTVAPCDSVNVTLNRDALKLAATSAALQELFNRMGLNIGFELPQFDLTAEITSLSDIRISLAGVDTINLDLNVLGLSIGDSSMVIGGMPDLSTLTFSDNLPDILGDVLKGVDINAFVNLTLVGNEYNLAAILREIAGLSMPDLMFTIDADDNPTNGYQDIELKTQLKLQLIFDIADPSKSRALFELYLLQDIAIAKASTTVPLIGVYVSGKNIYLEINNLENVNIPKIKLQADIMTMLADMIKGINLDLNLNLKDLINGAPVTPATDTPAAVAGTEATGLDNIAIAINNDAIRFNATSAAITQLLSTFGIALSLPEMNIAGEIANIDGGSLSLSLNGDLMNMARFDLNVDKIAIGQNVAIDKIDTVVANDYQYDNGLADLVGTLLEGIDIGGNVNLEIPAGLYDISGFLTQLGIAGIPPLKISFTRDVVMESEFKFQLNYDSINPANSKGLIEWTVTNPQEFMFIDAPAGTEKVTLLGVYIDGEAIYVDLSNIIISNIRLPKVKINIDIFTSLIDMLRSLNVDFVFDLVSGGNSGVNGASDVVGGGTISEVTDTVILGFSSQALHLKASAMAIQLLLAQFGIEIMLPQMDLSVDITELTGINVALSAAVSDKNIKVNLLNIKSAFGQNPTITLPENYKADKAYGTTLADTIINVIGDVDITGQIDIKASNSSFDLRKLINSILALTEQSFDVPINVNFDNFSNIIYFDVKWHLDRYNPGDSLAAISIYSSDGGLAISIFHKNNRLYVDLSSLGLMKFYIDNLNITGLIKSLLSGLSPIMSADIGTLLGDALNGLVNPAAAESQAQTIEELAKAAADKEKLNAAAFAASEGDETIDLLTLIFSTLDITDTLITLDFNKALVSELIEKAGIYLGIDLYGGVQFDLLKGTLDGSAQIDDLTLGFNINVNRFGEFDSMKNNIVFPNFKEDKINGKYPTSVEIPNSSEYASYELTSTLDFLTSILGGVDYANPGATPKVMWIDLTTRVDANRNTYNADQNGYGNGGAIKISIQRLTQPGTYNGFNLPTGGIIVGIYKNLDTTVPVIWVYIDPTTSVNNINIVGTDSLLYLLSGAVTGGIIKIPISVDLAGLLGGALDPIFGSLPEDMFIKNNNAIQGDEPVTAASNGDGGNIASVAEATDPAAADDTLDVLSLFKDISVNFYSTATTKINVSLDGAAIDNLLTNLLHDLLYNLDLPQIGGPAHVNYAGTRTGEYAFFDELFAKVIKPFAKDAIGAAGGLFGLVEGSVYDQLFDVVRRILPLPRMTDLTATLTLANSQLQSLDIISSHKDTDEFLKAHLHLAGAAATGVIDWGNIPGDVVKDPYSNDKITAQFNEGSAKAIQVNDRGGSHKNAPVIVYGGDFNLLKDMDNSGNYTPGNYNITATAFGETINIPVEILDKKAITQIMPIIVPAYGEVPNKIVATFEDGSVRTIKNVNINVEKPAWNESRVVDNVQVTLSDGTVLGTTSVTFIDGTVGSYTTELYVDAYSKNSLLTALPDKAFIKYNYGYYSSVPITWIDTSQLSSLTNEEWINGRDEPYTITAIIDDGSANPQQLIYNVHIRTINVASVRFDGEYYDGYLTVDPILALSERNDIAQLPEGSERPESKVFPSTAKVTYTDGRSENLDIRWDNAQIDAINYTLNGGTAELDVLNALGDTSWTSPVKISVNILARSIKYAKFGVNADGTDQKILKINPYEYLVNANIIPNKVEAVFTEGGSAIVPCTWILPENAVTPKGGYVQAELVILPNTSMESRVKTLIEIEQIDVVGLDYPINEDGKPEYTFDKAAEVLYGDSSMLEEGQTLLNVYAPKYLTFKLINGEVRSLPITSNFTEIVRVSADGGVIRGVTVTLGVGMHAESFVMDVRIPSSTVTGLAEGYETITIEKAKILSLGADAFPTEWTLQFGENKAAVKVKWWLDNIDINSGGMAELLLGTDTPEPQDDQSIRIRVNVVDGLN